jgi:single-stranded-DNA-specific exonuclease
MKQRYSTWESNSTETITNFKQLKDIIYKRRSFTPITQLNYGNHGLQDSLEIILSGIKKNQRIALYADYDVDGTMSCVSWVWFLEAIGYDNYTYYIPDRFTEGYGVHQKAIEHLVLKEKAQMLITMDCGITANKEAKWCQEHNCTFICTDHHLVQPELMPDSIILNPKFHPEQEYQELCGCGIVFVLLRQLGRHLKAPEYIWTDLLALTAMATICDCVALNAVNHRLAYLGVRSLLKSKRNIFKQLISSIGKQNQQKIDELDIGFRIGPMINAVGRLDHGKKVVAAFIEDKPQELVKYMQTCNEKRKELQQQITLQAQKASLSYESDNILFLGGDWHKGVVGIAASRISEVFWKPVWLFDKSKKDTYYGSARSIAGFDLVAAMRSQSELFDKFGGHKMAAGFSFPAKNAEKIRLGLNEYSKKIRSENENFWNSKIHYDATLCDKLLNSNLVNVIDEMRPFGFGFEEPLFKIKCKINKINYYKNKQTGEKQHTAIEFVNTDKKHFKIMFFNELLEDIRPGANISTLVNINKNYWNNQLQVNLIGRDISLT